MRLKEKVKNLPSSPGIYLMKDAQGGVLYVGKAKNLKRRIQSYFHNSDAHSPKVDKLVKHLRDFDYILTDTEFEAFLLECKLIKEYQPIYNKKMKSPLSYSYIVIDTGTGCPKISTGYNPQKKENRLLFGPYTSKNTVKKALQALKEHLKIICSNPVNKKNTCLNYSLGLCLGMCLGGKKADLYHSAVSRIIALLNGTDLGILHELEKKMSDASNDYDFETAAKYRDYLSAINYLLNNEKVIHFTEENNNFAVIERLGDSKVKLFLIKGNMVLFSKKYELVDITSEQLSEIIKDKILSAFNTAALNSPLEVTCEDLDQAQINYSYLNTSSCGYLIIPQDSLRAEKQDQLTALCSRLVANLSQRKGIITA